MGQKINAHGHENRFRGVDGHDHAHLILRNYVHGYEILSRLHLYARVHGYGHADAHGCADENAHARESFHHVDEDECEDAHAHDHGNECDRAYV